eukprot:m.7462 g.7462  ORF g.7462 m.7462 type:complete len:432 (-) comp5033_c0_seq1:135-1430(-)
MAASMDKRSALASADRRMFLAAYGDIVVLHRILALRHSSLNPLFLHRNLSYMRSPPSTLPPPLSIRLRPKRKPPSLFDWQSIPARRDAAATAAAAGPDATGVSSISTPHGVALASAPPPAADSASTCAKRKNSESSCTIQYHFLYAPCNVLSQTQSVCGTVCVWCDLRCPGLLALVAHLSSSHPRVDYKVVPGQGVHHVFVTPSNDWIVPWPTSVPGPTNGKIFRHALAQLRVFNFVNYRPDWAHRVAHLLIDPAVVASRRAAQVSQPFSSQPRQRVRAEAAAADTGPAARLYVHSDTFVPRRCDDHDTDDECDLTWLHRTDEALLADIGDLNDGERTVMQHWNTFMRAARQPLADADVPRLCRAFIEAHQSIIWAGRLRNNLVVHLCTLCEHQLLTPADLLALVALCDTHAPPISTTRSLYTFRLQGTML